MKNIEKLVPDTSVIIEGIVSEKISKKELRLNEVIIHEAVLAELEHQANQGKETGSLGLEEVKKIREISKNKFEIRFTGNRPKGNEIRYASSGEIDAEIRKLAWEEGAALITADKTQAKVAEAKGIEVIFIEQKTDVPKITLEKFFDKKTMSVHLRENLLPYAKKGAPGEWKFTALSKKKVTQKEIREISKKTIEEARLRQDGFIELERPGSTIIQLSSFRIVIVKPPLSDGWEITAVRPVKVLDIEDYKTSEKLMSRMDKAEGILISGAPGHGKTTFAQALAKYYVTKQKIVKTVEAPRDLQLGDEITQYAISKGSAEEIHDILLLSRPDYTLFDEMRNTSDFRLFADLRLTGIGLVGVMHATQPIDAIQRFIGRIELGVIPHVVDTVIFIKNGKVDQVFSVEMVVKVPSGMTEDDLARPVVTVKDFETGKLVFEIYSYGEETVVIPVTEEPGKSTGVRDLARKQIEREFSKYGNVKVDVISDNKAKVSLPSNVIGAVIGKQGKHIESIEKRLGISIDVEDLGQQNKKSIEFQTEITKKGIIFYVNPGFAGQTVEIRIDSQTVATAKIDSKGVAKLKRKKKASQEIVDALNDNKIGLVI